MTNHCSTAFPDFDYAIAPLIAQLGPAWSDSSYRNDACPSAFNETLKWQIFFDYADPTQSEFPEARAAGEMNRYQITDQEGERVFASDDWNAIARFITGNAAEAAAAQQPIDPDSFMPVEARHNDTHGRAF